MPDVRSTALFAATAAFVVWRTSDVAVLVDLAYSVNTATRIALGDVPYADFPLAHAPLHFVIQAGLIKALGPSYPVQIAYAAVVGGVATALAYILCRRVLAGSVPHERTVAAVLAAPLVPLGVHAILPHPFYDADACVLALLALLGVLEARERPSPARWLLAGALLTLPLWAKQNIGGAFLVAAAAGLALDAWAHRERRAGLLWCAAGITGALAAAALTLQLTSGIPSYLRWTWTFAMEGRGVAAERVAAFWDPAVVWPALLIVLPLLAMGSLPPLARAVMLLGALALPAAVAVLVPGADLSVPELFPPVLIAAVALASARMAREGPGFELALPWLVLATVIGTLMSQGLYGSTFAIFPLLVLAIATIVRDGARFAGGSPRVARSAASAFSAMLIVAGGTYTLANDRLRFIHVDAPGPVARSTFPTLAGLSARGPYVDDLDEILRWTSANVPPAEGMVFLPGEDPVFFALGRRPALPSVYFYDIATPYSPGELAVIADRVGLRWVFVKHRLQLTTAPPRHDELVRALTERATLVAETAAYRVYRR